jgi:phosphohistidine phosphatase
MRVVLVHHAEAVGPEVDPQRPLSTAGQQRAAMLANRLKHEAFAPQAIWHSGKLRARQTAEAFLLACAPFAEFKMIRGLLPDDPPAWLREELAEEARDVLVVGHIPNIMRLAALLDEDAALPQHGYVMLEKTGTSWRRVSGSSDPARS